MHEMGILFKMLEQVERILETESSDKVLEIHISVGELSGVLPVFLKKYFPIARQKNPIFSNTELIIRQVPSEGICAECETIYNIRKTSGLCPNCRSRNRRILSGRDFILDSITLQSGEQTELQQF